MTELLCSIRLPASRVVPQDNWIPILDGLSLRRRNGLL